MKKKLEDLEIQRNSFESKLIKDVEWLKNVLKLNEIEGESATRDLETIQKELDSCMCDLNNFAQDYEKCKYFYCILNLINQNTLFNVY